MKDYIYKLRAYEEKKLGIKIWLPGDPVDEAHKVVVKPNPRYEGLTN